MSQQLTQIQELQSKVNSLSDATELYDPESESSSGATHVPSQSSTIPSPRTTPCCDSGLPHDTRNIVGTSGNVFERPAREGRTSTLFNNSKNLASSSQELRPDTTDIARKREGEMRREPQSSSIPLPHFQSGGGMLGHTGGTYSHSGLIDYPDLRFRNCIWENLLTLWSFKAGTPTSELRFVHEQPILRSPCTGSKKLRQQGHLTNL